MRDPFYPHIAQTPHALPALSDCAILHTEQPNTNRKATDMSPTIIVVEDNQDLLFLYRAALEQKGYTVVEATSTASVIAMLDKVMPALIILDIEMPAETGVGVIDHLRADERYAAIRVVVITANDRWRERVGDRVDMFLVKPIGITQLLDIIKELVS